MQRSASGGLQDECVTSDPEVWLLIRFTLVMVPLVFVINGLTKGSWFTAFFFAIAVAVGLTPEMLPMIVYGQPGPRRCGDVAPEGHRQAAQRDPELRRDGRSLHRQDRHPDPGQGRSRKLPGRLGGEDEEVLAITPSSTASSRRV